MAVKEMVNVDWAAYEKMLAEANITSVADEMESDIAKTIQEYKENIKEEQYGDSNGDGIVSDDDTLTDEEQDLLSSPDDEL